MAVEGRQKSPSILGMADEERRKSLQFLVLYVRRVGSGSSALLCLTNPQSNQNPDHLPLGFLTIWFLIHESCCIYSESNECE